VGEAAGQEVELRRALDKGGGLFDGQGACFNCWRADCGHAQAIELSERCSSFDDVEFGVCTNVDESELVDLPKQRSSA